MVTHEVFDADTDTWVPMTAADYPWLVSDPDPTDGSFEID